MGKHSAFVISYSESGKSLDLDDRQSVRTDKEQSPDD